MIVDDAHPSERAELQVIRLVTVGVTGHSLDAVGTVRYVILMHSGTGHKRVGAGHPVIWMNVMAV